MSREIESEIERLEQRLAWWRELTDLLAQAQAAVLHSDLARLETLTMRQREVCRQLLMTSPNVRHPEAATYAISVISHGSTNLQPQAVEQRWSILTAEVARVEKQVGDLNRVYGALLRRARRTADIYCRVLASSAITYTAPPPQAAAESCAPRQVTHV